MDVVVIGSGLIGITAAYFLGQAGHRVTVVDREAGPGLATSFANGALLTPSMAAPWNAPGTWRVLLASLCSADAALQLRMRTLPGLAGWGVAFLRNSSARRFERNTRSNTELALYSLETMHALRAELGLEYGRSARGALRIFRSSRAFERAAGSVNELHEHGLRLRALTAADLVNLEPALAPIAGRLAGAIHYENDETGDAYRFCVALTHHARQQGVVFHFGVQADALEVDSGRVQAVISRDRRFVGDMYIVAAGSYTTGLMAGTGVRIPVQPAKGYSITLDADTNEGSLRTPIIDDHLHAAVVPLGDTIRVAGTAEFAGYDERPNPARTRNLMKLLTQVLPEGQFDPATARPWCGLRALSVDGVPLIGPTGIENLMVNTGHGHLGWTMAAGSARLLSDLVSGKSSSLRPAPYDPRRFNP